MTLFQDRERAFEQMFVHDEKTRFLALALRNKMLGQWAAQQMGLSGADATAYIENVRSKVADAAGEETVAAMVHEDLAAHGLEIPDAQIRRKMTDFLQEAIARVKKGGP